MKSNLGCSFEDFKKDIYDEKKFEQYMKSMEQMEKKKLEKMEQQNNQEADFNINLQPCSEEDLSLAKLNCVIKLKKRENEKNTLHKLRRFISKQIN